jgi:hypothetical protein
VSVSNTTLRSCTRRPSWQHTTHKHCESNDRSHPLIPGVSMKMIVRTTHGNEEYTKTRHRATILARQRHENSIDEASVEITTPKAPDSRWTQPHVPGSKLQTSQLAAIERPASRSELAKAPTARRMRGEPSSYRSNFSRRWPASRAIDGLTWFTCRHCCRKLDTWPGNERKHVEKWRQHERVATTG